MRGPVLAAAMPLTLALSPEIRIKFNLFDITCFSEFLGRGDLNSATSKLTLRVEMKKNVVLCN